MSSPSMTQCRGCGKNEEQIELLKCPACFERICDECSYKMGGRTFCGKTCGKFFFFEDEEE